MLFISDGQTISGAFSFKFGDKNEDFMSDKKLAELRESLSELKIIVIDEMSLISADMLYKLDAKLKKIFNLKNKTPFGGISIILVGDLLQIPPVTRGGEVCYIFSCPKKHKQAYEEYQLWRNCEPMILKHNHRQGESSEWANILNRFRVGTVTDEDFKLLQGRETDDPHLDLEAMHLCYTNKEVQDHNQEMLAFLRQ